jgi:hypothetical protein
LAGDQNILAGEFVGPAQRIDPPELQEMRLFMRDEPLDLELPDVPLIGQKNLKKKSSGISSVRSLTLSSPFLSWLLRTLPTVRNSTFFNDLEVVASFQFHPGRAEEDADGPRRPALLADHFTQILGGDFEFQNRGLFSFKLGDDDFVGLVYERFGDQFNELFHGNLLRDYEL